MHFRLKTLHYARAELLNPQQQQHPQRFLVQPG
jgi:hypothetical protein